MGSLQQGWRHSSNKSCQPCSSKAPLFWDWTQSGRPKRMGSTTGALLGLLAAPDCCVLPPVCCHMPRRLTVLQLSGPSHALLLQPQLQGVPTPVAALLGNAALLKVRSQAYQAPAA
jgi:hypothetical protein